MTNSNTAFRNALVAARGFLFGFDTAVISGVEKFIQTLWQLNQMEHGFTVASALIGTVTDPLLPVIPPRNMGEKKFYKPLDCCIWSPR